jgi:hypothetical protein
MPRRRGGCPPRVEFGVEQRDLIPDAPGRAHGGEGVVLVPEGRAEEGHHAVFDERVDEAALGGHRIDDDRKVAVEQGDGLLGSDVEGEVRHGARPLRPHQPDEEGGDLHLLAGELDAATRHQQLFDDLRTDVPAEAVDEELALGHVVDQDHDAAGALLLVAVQATAHLNPAVAPRPACGPGSSSAAARRAPATAR